MEKVDLDEGLGDEIPFCDAEDDDATAFLSSSELQDEEEEEEVGIISLCTTNEGHFINRSPQINVAVLTAQPAPAPSAMLLAPLALALTPLSLPTPPVPPKSTPPPSPLHQAVLQSVWILGESLAGTMLTNWLELLLNSRDCM